MKSQIFNRDEKRKILKKRNYDRNIEHIADYCRAESELYLTANNEVDVTDGSFRIHPQLHFISFSLQYIDYTVLRQLLNPHEIKSDYRYDHRIKNYKNFYHLSINRRLQYNPIYLWTNPYNKYFPGVILGVSLPKNIQDAKSILSFIAGKLPKLKISYIEYTIDYMVDTPREALELQKAFEQYTKVLYNRISPNQKAGYVKYSKLLRFYCRGKDKNKQKGENKWPNNFYDRVRCEYILTRDKKMVVKLRLNTIEDLIKDTNFSRAINSRIQFKQAKYDAKYFPKIWESPYSNFQSTYQNQKQIIAPGRVYKDIENFNMFSALMQEQERVISRFEEKWKSTKVHRSRKRRRSRR
jgi:hypothetical protein